MKKRRPFLYGFLVLSMITLLSGMAQANTVVAETTSDIVSVHSPPAVLPTNVFMFEQTAEAISWYCTINPGYTLCQSVSIYDAILFTDMQSMKCYIYYTIQNIDTKLSILEGYVRDIDKYPFKPERAPRKYLASRETSNSPYRQPRDGLRC